MYCNEWYAMDTKEELLIWRNLIAKQNVSLHYSNECMYTYCETGLTLINYPLLVLGCR